MSEINPVGAIRAALFSSPAACLETIRNRVKRLKNSLCSAGQTATESQAKVEEDIPALEKLAEQVKQVTAQESQGEDGGSYLRLR